ncbi:1898_t:CDS:2, partial [Funneliformis geosporum]
MESEIDLLRQENARLVVKNYELKAEIMKLRQIIEENIRHDARVKELEQKNKELEAKLAILEQGSLVTLQNDKKMIAISDVDLSSFMIAKDSFSITSDLTHCKEDLSMTSAELVTLPEQVVKELIPACISVTFGNKSLAGISP